MQHLDVCACAQSCLTLFDPRDHQAPLSMEFPKQEYWNRLPFPTLGDLPDPGIEPGSLALQAGSLRSEPPEKPPNRFFVR